MVEEEKVEEVIFSTRQDNRTGPQVYPTVQPRCCAAGHLLVFHAEPTGTVTSRPWSPTDHLCLAATGRATYGTDNVYSTAATFNVREESRRKRRRGRRMEGRSLLVGWLLNVPATCECISGTDLLNVPATC